MPKLVIPEDVAELTKLTVAEQNSRMCEGEAMPLQERMTGTPLVRATEAKVERLPNGNLLLKGCEVSGCNKPNGNRRIYPERAWAAALTRMAPKLEAGMVYGSIDHPDWGGGALKDAPIIWRSVYFGENDRVFGDCEIIASHSRGKDMIARRDSGGGSGWSTRGYATAHRPTDDEKTKYGLADCDDDVVIIDDNYECIAIDEVDNPSWGSAVTPGNTSSASSRDDQGQNASGAKTENQIMNTVEELRKAHPDLVAQVETAAVRQVTAQLEAEKARQEKVAKAVESVIADLAKDAGLQIEKELTPAQFAEKEASLVKQIEEMKSSHAAEKTALENKLAATEALLKEATDKIAAAEAKQADEKRRADVLGALDEKLKGNNYAQIIRDRVVGSEGVAGKVAESTFNLAALDKFIADQTAEIHKVAESLKNPAWGEAKSQAAAEEGQGEGKSPDAEAVRKWLEA